MYTLLSSHVQRILNFNGSARCPQELVQKVASLLLAGGGQLLFMKDSSCAFASLIASLHCAAGAGAGGGVAAAGRWRRRGLPRWQAPGRHRQHQQAGAAFAALRFRTLLCYKSKLAGAWPPSSASTSRCVGLCVWITMAAILPFCMGTSDVGPWAHRAAPARAGTAASESTS